MINGPKVQVPTSLTPISDEIGHVRPEWQAFFHGLQQIAFGLSRSGPSSSRPTSSMDGRYIGMPYFDINLSTTVYLSSTNPDVWIGTFDTHKSADQSVTTTAMTNDTELSIPTLANDQWVGRFYLDIGAALRVTGAKIAITAPVGAVAQYTVGAFLDNTGAGNVDTLRATTAGQVLDFTAASIGTALNGMMNIFFHIQNASTGGPITLQFAQSSLTSSALTVRTGSQLLAEKIS